MGIFIGWYQPNIIIILAFVILNFAQQTKSHVYFSLVKRADIGLSLVFNL